MTLVHDLQRKALDQNIPISNLLRVAYTIAIKLSLKDFEQWLDNELNGYKNENELPEYRFVTGFMRFYNPYYGWLDVTIEDKRLTRALEHLPIVDKISEVEKLAESKEEIYRPLPPEMAISFARKNYGMRALIFLGKQQLHGIVDSVRTKILDWSLVLEKKGILGKEMNFNETERSNAKNVMTNYFIGNVANVPIQQGNNNTINIEQYKNELDTAKFLVEEIKKLIDDIPQGENKETLQADIASIECQLKSPKPKMGAIKELLNSAKNILEGTCGSLIASHPVIAKAFEKLFG